MPRKNRKDMTNEPGKGKGRRPQQNYHDDNDKEARPHPRPGVSTHKARPQGNKLNRALRSVDLHDLSPEQAIDRLALEIINAVNDGYSQIKIIHGKGGRGGEKAYILRDKVHNFLRGHKNVVSIDVERVSTGTNQGATIVKLKQNR